VTIGAKGFAEQYILARLVGHRLERAGYRVRYRDGLGSAVVFGALKAGDIDISVDYSGTIWTNEMRRTDVPERAPMLAAIGAWEKSNNVTMLGALGFENAYCFAMRGADARQRGIATIDDLVPVAGTMALASDPEFLERPEWAAIRRLYALNFRSTQAYSPTFMYRALDSKSADVISAYTSDGRIAAQDLVVLTDPRRAIPRYDAILQISAKAARDPRLTGALSSLIGRIGVEHMRSANYMVDRDADKKSPDAAAIWLEQQAGLR
jgi:osmoprotectant transport system permease protein